MPTLANSYRQLNVPVAVVADFDLLRSENLLKKLCEIVGIEFDEIQSSYNTTVNAASEAVSENLEEAISEVRDRLSEIENKRAVSGEDAYKISDVLQRARDWSEAKQYGINALKGGAHGQCEELLNTLADHGIFIVREGELESWDRSLSARKSKWIKEALNQIHDDSDSFQDGKDFVSMIFDDLIKDQ